MNHLSSEDVQGIVDTAIGDLNDLSTTDVDRIVSDALGSPATEDEVVIAVEASRAAPNKASLNRFPTLEVDILQV